MEKKLFITIVWLFACSPVVFSQAAQEKSYSFQSLEDEVSLQVERNGGEVKLRLFIKDITQYDHLLVERSAETPNYFGKCRYISSAEVKPVNGYLLQYDRYPYASNKDVYYRIKTVAKDGVERIYPAVLLPALQ